MTFEDARSLAERALVNSQVAPFNAVSVAQALVTAERDHQSAHGLSRLPGYCAQARSGKIDGHAVPEMSKGARALLCIDARAGFAFPAIDLAIEHLVPMVDEFGIAAATIRRSHHAGQLGAHVERLADQGLLALMCANTPKAMPPWGGSQALFGTNPMAFAAPRRASPDAPEVAPLVIDLSLSVAARGKIASAFRTGDPIPAGWALDAGGQPTTDAKAAMDGTLLPAGGPKGAALALMVEVLAATLSDSRHGFEASSFLKADGPAPQTGQFLLALRPSGGVDDFSARLECLIRAIEAQPKARLPGSNRLAARANDMIELPAALLEEIRQLANAKQPPS